MPSQSETMLAPADERTVCQLTGCQNRAIALIAWPQHVPVALCGECWNMVQKLALKTGKDWKDWLLAMIKPKSR